MADAPRSSESVIGLHTYNSAADLTSGHVITLDKNEFLFDLNTKNACTRPLDVFIKLLSTSNVAKEFSHFSSLPLSRLRTVDTFFDHPELNKLGEIQVYEQTRIRAIHKQGHNYINASWIDGYREIRKYIVAPSPISETVSQFWRSIYDRNSLVVVTLCKLTDEKGKPFLPLKQGEPMTFDDMTIELDNIRKVRPTTYSSVLKLSKQGVDCKKTIVLIAYMGWGSMGYPQRPSDILDLVTDMNHMWTILRKQAIAEKKIEENQRTPITLMCFDGFSKSCTVAALDILCRRLEASYAIGTPFVDILDTIARLRMLRGAACMKAEQFVFLSLAVLEYAIRHHLINVENLDKICLNGFFIQTNPDTV
uniref:Tyrosine-protein phosphatase domain-containing protein n=1 Tax=Caenorhabditis tropicalis TaxID=1561998 RepID=A0A1I7T5F2_9PELO